LQIPIRSDFYVYEHIRKDTGEVFYVGKGRAKRAYFANKYCRSVWWQKIVKKAGGFDVNFYAVDLTEDAAFQLERDLIAQYRASGVKLCNQTDGGDGISGCVRTQEWRQKIGAAHKGKTISPEVRKKISESVRNSGYVATEEIRRKISEAHKGKKHSLGYRHTDEWRKNQQQWTRGNKSRTGQKRSVEERAKASAALRGRVQGKLTCPHCGKQGGNAMRRWHFDNCSVGDKFAN